MALFLARARAARPGLQIGPGERAAITSICFHLDGIPLALELAAARVGALGLAEIAGGSPAVSGCWPVRAPLRPGIKRWRRRWSGAISCCRGRSSAVSAAGGVRWGLAAGCRRAGVRRPAAGDRAGRGAAGGAGGQVAGAGRPGAERQPVPVAGDDPGVRPRAAGRIRRRWGGGRPARRVFRGPGRAGGTGADGRCPGRLGAPAGPGHREPASGPPLVRSGPCTGQLPGCGWPQVYGSTGTSAAAWPKAPPGWRKRSRPAAGPNWPGPRR